MTVHIVAASGHEVKNMKLTKEQPLSGMSCLCVIWPPAFINVQIGGWSRSRLFVTL